MSILSKISKIIEKEKRPSALELATRIQSARAYYNALEWDPHRKMPRATYGRTETQQTFPGGKRLWAYRYGDRAFDNDYSFGSQILTLKRLTIGTTGGRPFFLGENAPEMQARWDEWAKSCGYQEGESYQEILGQILVASLVHGDVLAVCHPDITESRVRLYDADQVVDNAG